MLYEAVLDYINVYDFNNYDIKCFRLSFLYCGNLLMS